MDTTVNSIILLHYMCWKVEYIILIMISTLIDYCVARKMEKVEKNNTQEKMAIPKFIN